MLIATTIQTVESPEAPGSDETSAMNGSRDFIYLKFYDVP